MPFEPCAWSESDDAWSYGGIRSVGRYVGIVDEDEALRELYLVQKNRRILRQWIREEFGDAFVIVPFEFKRRT